MNPQYFLQVEKVTLMKIILRKTGRSRQARGHNVGVVVCQAPTKGPSKKQIQATVKSKTQIQGPEREIPTY